MSDNRVQSVTVRTYSMIGVGVAIVTIERRRWQRTYDNVTPSSYQRAQRAQAALMNGEARESELEQLTT